MSGSEEDRNFLDDLDDTVNDLTNDVDNLLGNSGGGSADLPDFLKSSSEESEDSGSDTWDKFQNFVRGKYDGSSDDSGSDIGLLDEFQNFIGTSIDTDSFLTDWMDDIGMSSEEAAAVLNSSSAGVLDVMHGFISGKITSSEATDELGDIYEREIGGDDDDGGISTGSVIGILIAIVVVLAFVGYFMRDKIMAHFGYFRGRNRSRSRSRSRSYSRSRSRSRHRHHHRHRRSYSSSSSPERRKGKKKDLESGGNQSTEVDGNYEKVETPKKEPESTVQHV